MSLCHHPAIAGKFEPRLFQFRRLGTNRVAVSRFYLLKFYNSNLSHYLTLIYSCFTFSIKLSGGKWQITFRWLVISKSKFKHSQLQFIKGVFVIIIDNVNVNIIIRYGTWSCVGKLGPYFLSSKYIMQNYINRFQWEINYLAYGRRESPDWAKEDDQLNI